ncbi:hypothetical protein PFICI_01912 [Pestalotiopsis fici W106-1]|uniref:Fe2OG dioxygenase domain-containing protein n=1 Tax=Pestalotiopsis fici (strain W106-1 / CGMCC3.15140) TaxID=1229662 RepID=W3XQ17_PESFW|nr:uncharacterized protein PFICI_01912 [Pestalotiopsis fici W106-1]ETS88084.1 hypothetical protein PFICI_01912 [Pestalotiopsis fici W106-1]
MTNYEIPLINIRPFLDPTSSQRDRDAVVSQVSDACKVYGFFQLEGHGVPLDLQTKVLECAKLFFDLPLEEKQKVGMEHALGSSKRGYEVIGGQQLQNDTLPDLKEVWQLGKGSICRPGTFQGPNLWPALPREKFQDPVYEYRQRMLDLAHLLLRILISGLPYDSKMFDNFMLQPVANVRLLHYPPQLSKDVRQLGAGAHTDFGCITVLLQQPEQTGLQVLYPPTDSWIPVPAVANRFVVNIGDLLCGWTRGAYRSAVHRVINAGDNHRYSAPFFYSGNMAFKLRPLDGSSDENAITVEEHILRKFKASYDIEVK